METSKSKNNTNIKEEKIINENISEDSESKKIDRGLFNAFSSICKIIILNENNNKSGIGFLIKLFRKDNPFYCLMTNESLINKEIIESNKEIEIYYNYNKKKKALILNENERYIKEY